MLDIATYVANHSPRDNQCTLQKCILTFNIPTCKYNGTNNITLLL